MTDQRIKLAEFCGRCHEYVTDEPIWAQPEDGAACNNCGCGPHDNFDPRNDANDCEALIAKLNEAGYAVIISMTPAPIPKPHEVSVSLNIVTGRSWEGDDYKHGVCDLAEKIIEQQEQDDG